MKKLISNTIVQWAGVGLSKLSGMAFVLIVTRALGADQFGKYNLVFTFIAFFSVLASFGVHTIAVREMAKRPEESGRILGDNLILSALFAAAAALLCIGASYITGYPADVSMAIRIAVISILVSPLMTPSIYFEANLQMIHVVTGNLLRDIAMLVMSLVLAFWHASFISYVWASIASMMATVAYFWIVGGRMVRPVLVPDLARIINLLKPAVPLGLSGIALYVYNYIDTIMLSKMSTMSMVGMYGVAYKFVFLSQQLPKAMLVTLFPLFSKYTENDPARARRYLQFTFDTVFIVALFMATMGILYSWDIICLMFGKEYAPSYRPLMVFSVNFLFMFPNMLLSSFLISNHRQTRVMIYMIVTSAINIGLNFYMIPRYGIVGAALTTMASEIAFLALAGTTMLRDRLFRIDPVPAIKMLATAGLILLLAKASKIIWWAETAVMIAVFMAATQLTKAYDYRKLRMLYGRREE